MSLALLLALVQAPQAPGELAGHALVYSAREKAVLLIGGDVEETPPIYRLAGSTWTALPGSELPARSLPAVAADERGNVLVHGGAVRDERPDAAFDFRVTGDTWLWDGSSWQQVATTGPAPRDHHALVFDSKRGVFVLFGGSDADPSGRTTLYGDTWEWRDARWQLVAESGPSPRAHHAMVYDPIRERTLLVGGSRDDRTWAWDGASWQVAARGSPAERTAPRMAWDARAARVILFGGSLNESHPADTWAWDGQGWSVIATGGPPGRAVHALAWDASQEAGILFGGADRNRALGDLWRFSGDVWTRLEPDSAQNAHREGKAEVEHGERKPGDPPDTPLSRELAAVIREQASAGFTGAVLVSRGDEVLLDVACGSERGIEMATSSRFWIASMGKQFTSAALLLLEERGKLDLDDPLSRFFASVPEDRAAITLRQILTHTSGLAQSYLAEEASDRAEALDALFFGVALEASPGARFVYSNANYALAAAVVEEVSGLAYADFVADELFAPAGMHDTGFAGPGTTPSVAPVRGELPERLTWSRWGGQGVFSTTHDLRRWYDALVAGRVLSGQSIERLWDARIPIGEGKAALGWFESFTPGGIRRVFTRGNDDFGDNSLIYGYPERDTLIVVLSHAGQRDDDLSWSRAVHAELERLLFPGQ